MSLLCVWILQFIVFYDLPEPASRNQVELPYYSKYLLVAAYLASYNPAISDKRFFCKVSITPVIWFTTLSSSPSVGTICTCTHNSVLGYAWLKHCLQYKLGYTWLKHCLHKLGYAWHSVIVRLIQQEEQTFSPLAFKTGLVYDKPLFFSNFPWHCKRDKDNKIIQWVWLQHKL